MPARRRTLVLLALPALVFTAQVAYASCLGSHCVGGLPASTEMPGVPGDGVLCGYVKTSAPPPSDWTGDPQSPPPYVFTRTQAWGDSARHAYGVDWNERVCPLPCPGFPVDPTGCLLG